MILICCWSTVLNSKEPNSVISYHDVPNQASFNAVMDLPVLQPDLKISYGSQPLQHGLLWKPIQKQHKSLVVLIHGGCWLNAFGVNHSYPMATALSQAGFPVWSLEYRRTGDQGGGWPGSLNDIKSALQQLDLLNQHGINTGSVILMGHSAGGHLALLAASELPEISFKQIIGLAAITDISRYALGQNSCQQATPKFMAGMPHEQPEAYHAANLIYRQIPENVMLLQGDADRIVPTLQADLFQVPKQILAGAGHFDWIHPGAPAFQKLMQVLQP